MADKSPRKEVAGKKLTTKEKQDRKRAKKDAKTAAAMPIPGGAKPGGKK